MEELTMSRDNQEKRITTTLQGPSRRTVNVDRVWLEPVKREAEAKRISGGMSQ